MIKNGNHEIFSEHLDGEKCKKKSTILFKKQSLARL